MNMSFIENEKQTIIVPYYFPLLPKVVRDLVFECNIHHRAELKKVLKQLIDYIHHRAELKKVLKQLIDYIFCVNCNRLIDPSLLEQCVF
jgi:hypothetical protein